MYMLQFEMFEIILGKFINIRKILSKKAHIILATHFEIPIMCLVTLKIKFGN